MAATDGIAYIHLHIMLGSTYINIIDSSALCIYFLCDFVSTKRQEEERTARRLSQTRTGILIPCQQRPWFITASSIAYQSSGLALISYCPAGTLLDSSSMSKHVDGHTADESGTRDDIAGSKPEHERR